MLQTYREFAARQLMAQIKKQLAPGWRRSLQNHHLPTVSRQKV
jgi:hypothetical protein